MRLLSFWFQSHPTPSVERLFPKPEEILGFWLTPYRSVGLYFIESESEGEIL